MRVIIQEEALRRSEGHWYYYYIQTLPTIEAEPVRHGRWGEQRIIGYDGIRPVWGKPCSECGHETNLYYPNYCPNCGAKMDAKEA